MEYSKEELEFIERYKTESSEKRPAAQDEGKKRDLTKLFYIWIGFLVLTPVIISSIFLVAMARLNNIFNNEGIRELTKDFDKDSVSELSKAKGFEGVEDYVTIYQARMEIVGAVFTVFIILIGISFILRFIGKNVRKGNENE